jgi:hypothetical protein
VSTKNFIWRPNQERASFLSRITVCAEVLSTSPVSSTEASEEAQLHDLGIPRIGLRKGLQGAVEEQHLFVFKRPAIRRCRQTPTELSTGS